MNFFALGINHTVADVSIRSQFALSSTQIRLLQRKCTEEGCSAVVVLNTCNRTEIYGKGGIQPVISIFLDVLGLDKTHERYLFVKDNINAIRHMFQVASGIDSMVLGDLEILGQIKSAFVQAKRDGFLDNEFERLANVCLQAARKVKSSTKISTGTTTLAYSAIKYLKAINGDAPTSILLIGCGQFGKRIARNIRAYLPNTMLTLTNRTSSKAIKLSQELQANYIEFQCIEDAISANTIIISAINQANQLNSEKIKSLLTESHTWIDLCVPSVFKPAQIKDISGKVIMVDEISTVLDKTLANRRTIIPEAMSIVEEHIQDFADWQHVFKNSENIQQYKSELGLYAEICPYLKTKPQPLINKYINMSMSEYVSYIRANQVCPNELDKNSILQVFLKVYHENIRVGMQKQPLPVPSTHN